ncbi:MAG TPA: IPExxxVDY family protein [Chitinophagaceae bacterium]|nr:IPExxxVDY family protein [Chitinophagaceae bacterium]HNF29745.1 IPExxxVDY family protein [Chitinophagaceae bacterium]HNL83061.1 IPExxxVDY family protein [Chitinophagaceae bacterium]HNM33293.1 IPExxxVDY family protein [Chitinophagaceae bacterium]
MKLTLDTNIVTDDFFNETILLGITTTIKNYKLCLLLNTFMGFHFKLNNNIEICISKRKRKYYFSVYESVLKNSTLVHYLYHNHNDGEYLLPEFKHIDFLWLMKGDILDTTQVEEIKTAIKTLNGVQMVAELTNEQIKTKGNMIF